jgi:type IX secretion system PorP/SprF family membrane protein
MDRADKKLMKMIFNYKITNMKRICAAAVLLVSAFSGRAQQDPQYNLYQFNQMVINPAYAGSRDALAIIASTRRQWVGVDGAPQTTCLSAHMPLVNKTVGVGLTIVQDKMGPRSTTGVYGNGAYILKVSQKVKLSFGLSAGYSQYKFNFTELQMKSTETSAEIFQNQSKGILDVNSGLFLRSNKFFAGLSATHMTDPTVYDYGSAGNELTYRLRTHLFITAGRSFQINENVIFAPTVMLKLSGKNQADLNLNCFLFKKVWLGVFFRGGYGPGGLIQYYITNKFRVAYSYDSGLRDARKLGSSHEIMIGFDFSENNKSKVVSPRFL